MVSQRRQPWAQINPPRVCHLWRKLVSHLPREKEKRDCWEDRNRSTRVGARAMSPLPGKCWRGKHLSGSSARITYTSKGGGQSMFLKSRRRLVWRLDGRCCNSHRQAVLGSPLKPTRWLCLWVSSSLKHTFLWVWHLAGPYCDIFIIRCQEKL